MKVLQTAKNGQATQYTKNKGELLANEVKFIEKYERGNMLKDNDMFLISANKNGKLLHATGIKYNDEKIKEIKEASEENRKTYIKLKNMHRRLLNEEKASW